MQREKRFTKYIKTKDDSNEQRLAFNNLIKLALAEHKEVVALAEALILNLTTFPSAETWLCFLEGEPAHINAKIGKGLCPSCVSG